MGAALLTVAALVGLIAALYEYLTPLTGVTGTLGALIVVVACGLLALAGLILMVASSGRGFWRTLTVLGIVGTFTAALFLHAWIVAGTMVAALVGVLLDMGLARFRDHDRHQSGALPS
ncbi:hypothetical protein RISW2_03390 [Roseivivax isoporae LMG 25204]|uniref:Uncharacterized protein n=2 Tax=Roseivivax TaxID=93682 RepID=X7F8E8_9RHOB|nr:hypothetical protein RISW2_03390 [Roseivivax isoporae LMG 25204]